MKRLQETGLSIKTGKVSVGIKLLQVVLKQYGSNSTKMADG
jgi:hypothetical protein